MTKLTFIQPDGKSIDVDATNGATVMEVVKEQKMPMLAACGGSLACATCHVIVDEAWYEKSGELSEAEEDLLDTAHGLTNTSRLCCQMKVSDDIDGLVMTLPPM